MGILAAGCSLPIQVEPEANQAPAEGAETHVVEQTVTPLALPEAATQVGGSWTLYTAADGLVDNSVRVMAAGPDGSMWFGTDGGVSQYKLAE